MKRLGLIDIMLIMILAFYLFGGLMVQAQKHEIKMKCFDNRSCICEEVTK